jgi:hypothetical protein
VLPDGKAAALKIEDKADPIVFPIEQVFNNKTFADPSYGVHPSN